MFGNYPVNDDWIFVRQVEAFNSGIFKLSAILDPSFVSQGFLGLIWGRIFGINFVSLQVLTLLITLIGLGAFIAILRLVKVPLKIQAIAALLFLFNPLVFTSAFSFMTDNYFITLTLLSTYFYLKFLIQRRHWKFILLGSFFMLLSILVRQIGVLTGAVLVCTLFIEKKYHIKNIFIVLVFIVTGILISVLWPRFGVHNNIILFKNLAQRLGLMLLSLHYFPLFIFPLLLSLRVKLHKIWVAFFTAGTSLYLFMYDFFPVGNILYLEDLYSKSDFKLNFSLFDNIFFKALYALIIAYSISKLLVYFLSKILKFKNTLKEHLDSVDLFLLLGFVFNFAVLLVSSDFYDRYLLPALIFFILLVVKKLHDLFSLTPVSTAALALFLFVTIALQREFSAKTNLMWRQAQSLSAQTGLIKQIDLNDTYTKYMSMKKTNDFTGKDLPGEFEKKCFVQDYTTGSTSKFWLGVESLEKYLDDQLSLKKKPPYVIKKQYLSRASKNTERFIYNEQYFSLLYNLVGKKSYVAAWCLEY